MIPPGWRRFGAVDVHYPPSGGACAALVVAADARFAAPLSEHVAWLDRAAPYQPGRFYLREVPAIRAVLADTARLDLLVVDGYVDLDPHGHPGLGAHVYQHTGVPVVGVAKTPFRTATHAVPVRRGEAARPVYVTAIGIGLAPAAAMVEAMSGQYRVPDALRRADALCRTGYTSVTGGTGGADHRRGLAEPHADPHR
ncbi:MAG TPA: endonuclease V [Micromonosporaceae bacterium]